MTETAYSAEVRTKLKQSGFPKERRKMATVPMPNFQANMLSLADRLAKLGFTSRRDDRTYHDYRRTIYHAKTYDILGRMDYQEALAFVRERDE
jgi:hypothetical protein